MAEETERKQESWQGREREGEKGEAGRSADVGPLGSIQKK